MSAVSGTLMVIRFLAFLCFSIFLLGCQSPEEKVASHLDNARSYLDEGNSSLANVELKNALKIEPNTPDAYYMRALILGEQKEWRAMYDHLQRTVELEPTHLEAQEELAKLFLMSGEMEQARIRADKVAELAPGSRNSLLLLGAYHLRAGDIDAAGEYVERLREANAEDLEVIALDVSVSIAARRYEAAQAAVERAKAHHPEAAATHLYRIRLAQAMSDATTAVLAYEDLIELDNQNLDYWQALSAYHIQQDDLVAAEAVLRQAVIAIPDDSEPKLLLARFLAGQSPELAIESLEQFIELDEDNELRFALAGFYQVQGRMEEAASEYEMVASSDASTSDVLDAQAELALVALHGSEAPEAQRLIEQVLQVEPNHPKALLLQAYLDLQEGRVESAIANIRVVLRDDPINDKALSLLGEAYLMQESMDLAESSFAQTVELNPYNLLAVKKLGAIYAQRDELERAARVLAPAVGAGVADAETVHTLVQVYLASSQWEDANRTALVNGHESSEYVRFIRAVSLDGQGFTEEAAAEYERILQQNPENSVALQGLVRILNMNGEGAAERYLLEQVESATGTTLAAENLARRMLAEGRYEEAESLLARVIATNPRWEAGYDLLGHSLVRQGNLTAASDVYAQGIAQVDGAVLLMARLASLHEKLGDYAAAEELYREILETNPEFDAVANNLAMLVSRDPTRLGEALEIASRFEGSDDPYFVDNTWLDSCSK